MEEVTQEPGSQTVESQETVTDENLTFAYEAFGIPMPQAEPTETESKEGEEKPPAIEEKPEPKVIKIKHNKEEIEVDVSDEKIPEYVQKSLALDKERERKSELEKNLDRAAKLAGFKDHAEYVANFDRLEQEAKQREENAFNNLRQSLRQEAEEAGLDADKVEAYLDNHPFMKQAKQTLLERQEAERIQSQTKQAEEWTGKWKALYDVYPDLLESAQVFTEGGTPDWYTPDMQARIERGYDPKDAYELAHMDKIQAASRKKTEQQIIKEQQLGKRAQVETETPPNDEPVVPEALTSAFSMFGLDPKRAKNYVKK